VYVTPGGSGDYGHAFVGTRVNSDHAVDAEPFHLVAANCPLCGPGADEPVGVGEDFEYRTSPDSFLAVRCSSCGLIRIDPRPSSDEFERMYPDTYHAFAFDDEGFGVVHDVRERLEARRLTRWLRGVPPGARVLDVGCGDGFHLDVLRRRSKVGYDLSGIDLDKRAVSRATGRGLLVEEGALETSSVSLGSVDCALLIQTIEHVEDPLALLRAIRERLRPGGRLIVVTDNTGSFDFRWFGSRWWGGYHFPRHLHLFDQRSLRTMAAEAGFDIAALDTMVSPVNWVYSIRNLLVDHRAPRWLVDQFSLRTPVSLAIATIWDLGNRLFGRGALLRADLRRPTSDVTQLEPGTR
jgi:SAM-dependent methyltransferase